MGILLALGLLGIAASLTAAAFFMLRGPQQGKDKAKRMAQALTIRIGLSVLLFLCILLAWQLGYIQPTGIPAGR